MSDVIAEISELINKKKWKEAARLGSESADDASVNGSAHFWLQWGLSRTLVGLDASDQFARARQCADFTTQMEGDLYRGMALAKAREHKWNEADDLLYEAWYLFDESDDNRRASVEMTHGRIMYLKGDYQGANEQYKQAAYMWQMSVRKSDPQWIMNNRFYWLKVRARMGYATYRLYREFTMSPEPRRDRRVLAWLYHRFGAAGVYLGDAFEKSVALYRSLTG